MRTSLFLTSLFFCGLQPVAQVHFDLIQSSPKFTLKVPEIESCNNTVAQKIRDQVISDLKHSGRVKVDDQKATAELQWSLQCEEMPWSLGVQLKTGDRNHARTFTFDPEFWADIAHNVAHTIYLDRFGVSSVFQTRLAYIEYGSEEDQFGYHLMVSEWDGSHPQVVLESPQPIASPAWSPDGKRLLYVSYENKESEIYLHDLEKGSREKITEGYLPSWQVNGHSFSYVSTILGHAKIYEYDLKSHKEKPLTFGRWNDYDPEYSFDGSSLYFSSDRNGGVNIFQLQLSNGRVSRMTYGNDYNSGARVNQDGKLAMIHRGHKQYSVAVQQYESVQPIANTDYETNLAFSPNGQMLVYTTLWRNRSVLGMVSLDGKTHIRLRGNGTHIKDPAWSSYFGGFTVS